MRAPASPEPTHAHGGHVVLVGFPHFLHDLLLGAAAVLDGALHRDGPLGVVQGQVLQAGEKQVSAAILCSFPSGQQAGTVTMSPVRAGTTSQFELGCPLSLHPKKQDLRVKPQSQASKQPVLSPAGLGGGTPKGWGGDAKTMGRGDTPKGRGGGTNTENTKPRYFKRALQNKAPSAQVPSRRWAASLPLSPHHPSPPHPPPGPSLRKVSPGVPKGSEQPYDEMVIFVSVSCSTFFKFRPSLPIRRPTKLLWAKIFRGTSSALERRMGEKKHQEE